MLDELIAFGLLHWHGFWTPVRAWAGYHWVQHGDALRFFAIVVAVIGLPTLSVLLFATLAFLISDRRSTARMRASRRWALLLGLATELEGARSAAARNAAVFDSGDEVAWTILPHWCIDQAIGEAALLDLTRGQIVTLLELRLRILRANGLAGAGMAAARSWSPAGLPAVARDSSFSREMRGQFEAITGLCDLLLSKLGRAPSPPRGYAPIEKPSVSSVSPPPVHTPPL